MATSATTTMPDEELEAPYPLRRLFYTRIVPALVLFIFALVATMGLGTRKVLEKVYLELATKRAVGIAAGVERAAPEAWHRLMTGAPLSKEQFSALVKAFEDEQREFHLAKLKVYDLTRRTLYATDISKIGKRETGAALGKAIKEKKPSIVAETLPDGTKLYELYVPLVVDGELRAVFELYEPVSYLDRVVFEAAMPIIAIPGLLLVVLVILLGGLVSRAQADIDLRTNAINKLRRRIESLVSRQAVEAMRRAGDDESIPSERTECTLLFSDVRGFTDFAETRPPEEVFRFLGELMEVQVEIIQRHSGDVDKMIGDAVFARFHGENRERNALDAAREIQQTMAQRGFPLGVGIGVYSGPVIAGGIGRGDRLDYTVIGDSVNVASRLCSAARAGEIVCDTATYAAAGLDWPAASENVTVKGRSEPVAVYRFAV